MAITVTEAFVRQYAAEVKAAYQREGSLLRQAVRIRTGVIGERIHFPLLGKGEATDKARHADVVPMNLEHTKVHVDMVDKYGPEYIDDLDQFKINWDLRADYARASAWALGRQTDAQIVEAVDTSDSSSALDKVQKDDIDLSTLLEISKKLTDNDVPQDGNRWAIISPHQLMHLLQITGATSSDFVGSQLLVTGREPAFWLGFRWIVYTGDFFTTTTGSDAVTGIFFHQPSMGLAIGKDIHTQIDWVPQKVAYLVNSWMSMGAVVIDPEGVCLLANE